MSLSTHTTPSPAFLDILHDGKVCIGQAVCEESGFWVFYPTDKPGYYEAHTLLHIAALLDRMNAPYDAELKLYFDDLPKEISREPQDDTLPF